MHPEHGEKIFFLIDMDDTGAKFHHTPLFGDVLEVKVGLDLLKKWKFTKKDPQQFCPAQLTCQRLPHNCEAVLKEMEKIQVNALLMEAYMANRPADEELLGFTCHPNAIFALKKLKKKELKLLPIGNCVPVQEKEYDKIVNKGKGVVVWYAKKAYQVQPFKALANFQKPDANSILCPFFWVKPSDKEGAVNMTTSWMEIKGLQIPVLENPDSLKHQTVLCKAADLIVQQPPAKKAKVQ